MNAAIPTFAQITIRDLDEAVELFSGGLGLEISGEVGSVDSHDLGRIYPPDTTIRFAYLRHPTEPDSLALRLIEIRPAPSRRSRDNVPTHQPGSFGISIIVADLGAVSALLSGSGGAALSEPQVFRGSTGQDAETVAEVVFEMPERYYVTVIQPGPVSSSNDSIRIGSFSMMVRNMAEAARFWQKGLGLQFRAITDGVQRQWASVRRTPPDEPILTVGFAGKTGSQIYCATLPNLCEGLDPIAGDPGEFGLSMVGIEWPDGDGLRGWPEELSSCSVSIPPWFGQPCRVIRGPDGVLVEIGEAVP